MDISKKGKGAVKEKFKLKHLLKKRLDVHLKFHPEFKAGLLDVKSISQKFPVKDQDGSSSCGGQAVASDIQNKVFIRDGVVTELSAKDVYSHCFLPGGGSSETDLQNWVESGGIDTEASVPSYINGIPQGEAFYETIAPRNQDVAFQNMVFNSFSFNGNDINQVRQAIDTGNGCICALLGNNTCWRTSNGVVQVPAKGTTNWGHWLNLVSYDDTKKLVCAKNSWGADVGDEGYYYIPYSYFQNGLVYGEWVSVLGAKGEYISLLQKVVNLMQNIINLLKK